MADHKLNVTYDDAAGSLTVTHVCVSKAVAGHNISHADTVELTDASPLVACLKRLVDANREAMEKRTAEYAITHGAAVLKQSKPGLHHLHLGGSVGPIGDVSSEAK